MVDKLRLSDDNRRWWTLGAMCFALFMVMLDNTAVNVALPSIQRDLDASIAGLEWTVNAYTLTFAVLLVTGGRLVDYVERVSGAEPERIRDFFAFGMLLNVFASMDLLDHPAPWAKALLESCLGEESP